MSLHIPRQAREVVDDDHIVRGRNFTEEGEESVHARPVFKLTRNDVSEHFDHFIAVTLGIVSTGSLLT
ncbi:hypothetical protein G0Q01_19515 [Yangia sp. PrR007]|nr:hypothetical protein [Salipiger sp. PrR007]NDW34428.1 hypothetical protein [Salipiger sp. PrR007]